MATETEVVQGLPIVCRLLAPELRAREQVVQDEVSRAAEEVRELPEQPSPLAARFGSAPSVRRARRAARSLRERWDRR